MSAEEKLVNVTPLAALEEDKKQAVDSSVEDKRPEPKNVSADEPTSGGDANVENNNSDVKEHKLVTAANDGKVNSAEERTDVAKEASGAESSERESNVESVVTNKSTGHENHNAQGDSSASAGKDEKPSNIEVKESEKHESDTACVTEKPLSEENQKQTSEIIETPREDFDETKDSGEKGPSSDDGEHFEDALSPTATQPEDGEAESSSALKEDEDVEEVEDEYVDGEEYDDEEKDEGPDDDEIEGNPAYIPKSGRYYMHDLRDRDDERTPGVTIRSRADGQWKHDRFNEQWQRPKSRRELVNRYGYDIRNEDGNASEGWSHHSTYEVVERNHESFKRNARGFDRRFDVRAFLPARGHGYAITGNRSQYERHQNGFGGNYRHSYRFQNESSHGDDNDSPRERNFNNRGGYNRGRGRSYSRANQQHQDDRRDLRRPAVAASQRTMSRGRGRGDHYEQRGANRVYNKNASYRGMSRGNTISRSGHRSYTRDEGPVRGGRRGSGRGGSGSGGNTHREGTEDTRKIADVNQTQTGGKRYSTQRTAAAAATGSYIPPPQQPTLPPAVPPLQSNPPMAVPPAAVYPPPAFTAPPPNSATIPVPAPVPAYQANNVVYFDPQQQPVNRNPMPPRAKKRLEIVPPQQEQ